MTWSAKGRDRDKCEWTQSLKASHGPTVKSKLAQECLSSRCLLADLQLTTLTQPKRKTRQSSKGVFHSFTDAIFTVFYLYMMPLPSSLPVPSLGIAHMYAIFFGLYMVSELLPFTCQRDVSDSFLHDLHMCAQKACLVYACDHRLYHIPVELRTILSLVQNLVHSSQLQQILMSQAMCISVGFSALYISMTILRRGLSS